MICGMRRDLNTCSSQSAVHHGVRLCLFFRRNNTAETTAAAHPRLNSDPVTGYFCSRFITAVYWYQVPSTGICYHRYIVGSTLQESREKIRIPYKTNSSSAVASTAEAAAEATEAAAAEASSRSTATTTTTTTNSSIAQPLPSPQQKRKQQKMRKSRAIMYRYCCTYTAVSILHIRT